MEDKYCESIELPEIFLTLKAYKQILANRKRRKKLILKREYNA
jgi:hypothetical protein